ATAAAAPTTAGPVPRNGAPRANSVAPVPPVIPAAHPTILPEHSQSIISAPLAALSEEWPEALRQEIAQTNLANAQVALPVHLVEPALKRGRVIFSWRYVRSWIRPVPPGVSVHDGIELELPLKVIAPLFFGQQKTVARLQRKTTLAPEIPDLFFGFPQPQSPPEATVPQPELAAPQSETTRFVPKPADFKPADTNYKPADTNFYIWGDNGDTAKVEEDEYKRPHTPPTDFTSRRAMPKDV